MMLKRIPVKLSRARLHLPRFRHIFCGMTALTFDQAQQNLRKAVDMALGGEEVVIHVGVNSVRLTQDIPIRPPGYFASCYQDRADAEFEERICKDSKPILEE